MTDDRATTHCVWPQVDGSYVEVDESGSKTTLAKANITLSDCLACSGCVTSAESVLVEMQNHAELLAVLDSRAATVSAAGGGGAGEAVEHRVVIVSLSPQSCASVAAKHGISAADAAELLAGFLKRLGH